MAFVLINKSFDLETMVVLLFFGYPTTYGYLVYIDMGIAKSNQIKYYII